jgi:glycosyltransferase
MKLSAVIVVFNAEKTIESAITSFMAQRHQDKELLIVDGASSDRTLEIARSFNSDRIRILSERDHGIYDAMNKGLRLFSGDAVGFLGADDAFHDPDSLGTIAAALGNADIVYGDMHMVRDQVGKKVVRVWRSGLYHDQSFARGWMPAHATFYAKRHVIDRTGQFDLNYTIGADYDFMLRAMVGTPYRIQYIPKVLIDFQLGGTSSNGLRGAIYQNFECLRIRQRHLNAPFIDAAFFLKWARKLAQFRVG